MLKIQIVLLLLAAFMDRNVYCQSSTEETLDRAFQNAKKGMYWALGNIPEKKSQADNDLIDQDRLLSSVRLFKEVNGIRIESTGYFETAEVKLTIFKSTDRLLQEGYLKPDTLVSKSPAADTEKKVTKKKSKK